MAERHPKNTSGSQGGQFAAQRNAPPGELDLDDDRVTFDDVLARAAELQEIVPGAVLVGGSAAAFHARHRLSFDHDHVIADLAVRFDTILDNLEALGDWSMAKAQPGKIILGSLGGIETGVRQMFRTKELEVEHVDWLGHTLTVPTADETLRIKAWLALSRNQTRDFLDIAALADHVGLDHAAEVLNDMDRFYADINRRETPVATQVVRQLADPKPTDTRTIDQIHTYKGLVARWHDWNHVRNVLQDVSTRMLSQ